MGSLRRTLIGALLLAALTLVVAVALNAASREREYARLISSGDAALATDQSQVAIEAYSGAIALKSAAMLAYLKRGDTYRQRKDYSDALRDLREASRLDPSATQPLELIGDVNSALERHARAIESYEAYLELDKDSPRVLYKLALARYRIGMTAAAVTALRKAVAINDRMPEAVYLLGACLRDQDQTQEALQVLEQAVALSPAMIPAREALASSYHLLRRNQDEIAQLQALAALEPTRPERQVAVGLAYAHAGDPDEAVVTLRRVAERYPERSSVYVALGHVWLETAEARRDRVALGKALKALEGVARAGSASSEALTLYGRALLMSGDVVGAQRAFERAAQALPLDVSSLLYLATTAERLGRVSVCRDALVRYAALNGDDANAAARAFQIGDLSARLGEPAVAATWFRKAADLSGGPPATLFRLADTEARLGHVAAALAAIDQGLSRDPTDARLLALRKRLQ
jgi:tetratricopeptide (TPR) repeat protein